MNQNPRPPAAINPLPPVVIALAVVIFGIEMLFTLGSSGSFMGDGGLGWRQYALENYAFYAMAVDWMLENSRFPPDLLIRFVTYPLLHLSLMHAVFVCVFILAMGKMVGEAFGNISVLIVFWGASIGGALVYGLVSSESFPLVGGFPGVYGLIGGFTFIMWVRQRALGQSQMQAFRLIGILLLVQLLFGVVLGGRNDWIADVAGFVTGFGLSFMLVPGGWAQLREQLRRMRR
ncbi:MAG: rhomboid family intramembrane serine protease [Mangrovicoccus sp.]